MRCFDVYIRMLFTIYKIAYTRLNLYKFTYYFQLNRSGEYFDSLVVMFLCGYVDHYLTSWYIVFNKIYYISEEI